MRRFALLLVTTLPAACSVVEPAPQRMSLELYDFGCQAPEQCQAPSESCYQLSFSANDVATACTRACESDDDCPDGRCMQFTSSGLCFQSCRQDDDCASGFCGDVPSPDLPGYPTSRICWFYPPSDANCTAATTCEDCTPLLGCGWCKTSERCSSSNEHCEGFLDTWAWETTECGP